MTSSIYKKFFFLLFAVLILTGQEKEVEDKFSISLSGYVKTDIIYDSRQTVSAREGHLLLFPQKVQLDDNLVDINSQANFNILSIQSRLNAKISAAEILGGKLNGVIEGEFFGNSENDINGFRLRHAFLRLDWSELSLLAGQYWHPLFSPEVYPGVVSFNSGIPFQPFARNPQIRVVKRFGSIALTATAYSQRDFSSTGPDGITSAYMRNSAIPGINFNTTLYLGNFILGGGIDFKSIKPQLVSDKNFSNDENVTGYSGVLFGKYQSDKFTIKIEGTYGENLYDLLMLGGYACYEKDAATGIEKYTPLSVYSFWTDLSYNFGFEVGLFAGYTQSGGSEKELLTTYGRGVDIDYIYRISPRIVFNSGKLRIGSELEFTTAAYGETNNNGKVFNSEEVSNLRLITAVYLFF